MGKTNSTIEINGKRYDATTGAVLDAAAISKVHRAVDGIVAGHSQKTVVRPTATTNSNHQPVAPAKHRAPSMRDVVRPAGRSHSGAHTPQPAQTLMRRVVSKPPAEHRPRLKAQGRTQQLAKRTVMELVPKLSVTAVDNRRLKHAQVIPKSKLISRHTVEPLLPLLATAVPVSAPQRTPSRPAGRPQTTADLLQHAIEQATSHQQAAPPVQRMPRRSSRIVSVSTLVLLSLVLFGFVLHQNMPNIKLDLASSRAGFAAGLPANQPAGYSLNGLSAVTGQVALNFRSNSGDNRQYTLTEKASSWDSATLRDAFVSPTSNNLYQTVNTAGRTLYLFGQQNITWVNGGIWYQVRSGGALSNQQLIDIATSI